MFTFASEVDVILAIKLTAITASSDSIPEHGVMMTS